MSHAIFFIRTTITLMALATLTACHLYDLRPRCATDAHCGIGVCTVDGFCEDPPALDEIVAAPGEDETAPEPPVERLVCNGDEAEFAWHPLGELNGGVFARLIEHDKGGAFLVGGEEAWELSLTERGLELELLLEDGLRHRHDAAGLAVRDDRVIILGGEDLRGGSSRLEIYGEAEFALELDAPVASAPVNQVAVLPDGELVASHVETGISMRFAAGETPTPLEDTTGRRLVQTQDGVLAVGRASREAALVVRITEEDDAWRNFGNVPDKFTWTDMAVVYADTEAGEVVYLAGGLEDGELTDRVVRVNVRTGIIDELTRMQTARRAPAAAVLEDGSLVLMGGLAERARQPSDDPYLAPVERLYPSGVWTPMPGIPGDVVESSAVSLDECIAVVDGVGAPALWVYARKVVE